MNWRRGLLLAGIQLVVAASLLMWQEAPVWRLFQSERVTAQQVETEKTEADGMVSISFNPCVEGAGMCYGTSPQATISGAANLPIALLTGWHEPCRFSSGWDSLLEKRIGRTRRSETIIIATLCVLSAVQWFLVGGFPLILPCRWWLEPGAFITLCTLLAVVLLPLHGSNGLVKIPMLLAALAWLWWLGLLMWGLARTGGRLAARALGKGRAAGG